MLLTGFRTIGGFNPRPREGATSAIVTEDLSCDVSIHAPVKGRRPLGGHIGEKGLFQSTPP